MKSYYPSYVTSPSHKIFVKVILRIAVVQNLLQIWMPKLVYSLYLTLDNINMCFSNFHNFDFTAPLILFWPKDDIMSDSNVKDGVQIQAYNININKASVTHFSHFISINAKKVVRESQTQFRENFRKLRLQQNGGCLLINKNVE